MTNEVPAGLSPDAELRYRMVAHVLNTRMVMPDAAAYCAEELIRYVKTGIVPEVAYGSSEGWVDRDKVRFVGGILDRVVEAPQ